MSSRDAWRVACGNVAEVIERPMDAGVWARLVWLEQSHFVVRTADGLVVHIDPFVSRDVIPVERFIHADAPAAADRLRADCVFLTHDHADHTDSGTIRPLAAANPNCRFVGPEESIRRCAALGIDRAHAVTMCEGDEREIDGMGIRAVYARSTSAHDDTTHLGFVLRIAGRTLYNVGDTQVDPERYADRLEAVRGLRPDVMIVPVNPGCNNPGAEGAAWLVEWVDPALVVPCHFGCFKGNTTDPALFVEALAPARRESVRIMARCGVLELV